VVAVWACVEGGRGDVGAVDSSGVDGGYAGVAGN
jgi:hypothetical protein